MNVQQVNNKGTKRDAERSKTQILDAAAQLFAKHGFDNSSMQQIAKAAGVARGTPHYFFESKEGLFKACFERENETAIQVIPSAFAKLKDDPSPKEIIDSLIDVYLDFLEQNPIFFRLLQWASLENTRLIDAVSAHWQTILAASSLAQDLTKDSQWENEVPQLVYSIIGLCTVHYSFGSCLGNPMGVSLNEAFLKERKTHIKKVLYSLLELA